jgi:hypothetical protein
MGSEDYGAYDFPGHNDEGEVVRKAAERLRPILRARKREGKPCTSVRFVVLKRAETEADRDEIWPGRPSRADLV